MGKLFCDLKTDEEKANFFLTGRGYETGIVAPAIQNDVAMAYHRCAEYAKEVKALKAMLADAPQPDCIPDDDSTPTPTQIVHWLAEHEAQLSKTELGNAAPDHFELEYYIDDELGWKYISGPDPLALILEAME